MTNSQVTLTRKQLSIFLGSALALVVGLIAFFAVLSSKNPSSGLAVKGDSVPKVGSKKNDGFLGLAGVDVTATDGKVYIDESSVSDGDMHNFNFFSEKEGKNIHFFIVRASDGTYRVAADACEVCFAAHKGFRQVGNSIRCENCQVTYSKDKIALEKGGCNPGPIDKDALVENGKLMVNVSDIESTAYLF